MRWQRSAKRRSRHTSPSHSNYPLSLPCCCFFILFCVWNSFHSIKLYLLSCTRHKEQRKIQSFGDISGSFPSCFLYFVFSVSCVSSVSVTHVPIILFFLLVPFGSFFPVSPIPLPVMPRFFNFPLSCITFISLLSLNFIELCSQIKFWFFLKYFFPLHVGFVGFSGFFRKVEVPIRSSEFRCSASKSPIPYGWNQTFIKNSLLKRWTRH